MHVLELEREKSGPTERQHNLLNKVKDMLKIKGSYHSHLYHLKTHGIQYTQ